MAMQRFCKPQSNVQVIGGEPVEMSLKKATFKCVECGIEKRSHYSSMGVYCSNLCQQNYQFTLRLNCWLAGEYAKASPRWFRKAIERTRGYACGVCGLSVWMGQKLVLELDHIDGGYWDNSPDNLRLICPNCHSQTPTYKNRNKGMGRPNRRKAA